MNIKAFTILFFTLLAFILFVNIVNAEVVKDGLVYWSNETIRFFAGSSKIHIDNNTYVIDYDLNKGWIKVHAEIPTLLAFCDPFSGKWIKIFVKRGDTNVTLPFKPQPYGNLRMIIISSPWGFGVLKEQENILSWGDYPVIILLSELARFAWERAFYSVCLAFAGFAYAYFTKKELLLFVGGRKVALQSIIMLILPIILILLILGLSIQEVTIKTVHDNQTIYNTIQAIVFDSYRIKQFYNYYYVFVFLFGFAIGLRLFKHEYLTTVKPLMDRIEINDYPINTEKRIIRDHDGEIARIEILEPIGEFIIKDNGATVKALVEIDRKDEEIPKKIELTNKKVLLTCFGVLGVMILGNVLNIFKVDLISMGIITLTIFILMNLNNIKDLLLTPSKVLTIQSTELITNDRYYADLLNGRLKEMAKVYNKLKKELIRKEFEIDYKIATEIFDVVKSLEVTPEPSDGGETS